MGDLVQVNQGINSANAPYEIENLHAYEVLLDLVKEAMLRSCCLSRSLGALRDRSLANQEGPAARIEE